MSLRHWISIHENGHVWRGETPISSPVEGLPYLENLARSPNGAWETRDREGNTYGVEAFDEPLVATSVELSGTKGSIRGAYGMQAKFPLSSLTVDPWDRFHGHTDHGVGFVFSKAAQSEFFSAVDSYDDDSFEWKGQRFETPPWLSADNAVEKSEFWSGHYQENQTPWDLGAPSPVFLDLLPRLKIPRARVLVLGSGPGNDANYLAQQGHVVTAVDFSSEALAKARQRYGSTTGLTFVEKDIFALPREWKGSFDLVLEHTCYCAIDPNKRDALVQVWRQMLHEQGQMLGVFFTMDKTDQPPFGGSEWEIRQRLQKYFQFLFWGRWRQSAPGREGKELAVFAQRRNL